MIRQPIKNVVRLHAGVFYFRLWLDYSAGCIAQVLVGCTGLVDRNGRRYPRCLLDDVNMRLDFLVQLAMNERNTYNLWYWR